jgi:hypothetical protein
MCEIAITFIDKSLGLKCDRPIGLVCGGKAIAVSQAILQRRTLHAKRSPLIPAQLNLERQESGTFIESGIP